jgi:phage gp45-like
VNNGIGQLAARIRNLFSLGEFRKRYGDGKIQAQTVFGRVVEKKEAFPYGFRAKAKQGTVLVLCQGGNFDGFEILPVLDYDGGPELEEGDVALYTESGGRVILRENGGIEAETASGDVTVATAAGKILVRESGDIEMDGASGAVKAKGASIALQEGGLPAARKTDLVQSAAADDPAFWQWVTTVSSMLAALTGGGLTPPSMIMSKITGGSATVTIG